MSAKMSRRKQAKPNRLNEDEENDAAVFNGKLHNRYSPKIVIFIGFLEIDFLFGCRHPKRDILP